MTRTTYVRPNCTHVNMDMVHFSAICDVCGQEASMGWVYECQQDRLERDLAPTPSVSELKDASIVGKMKSMGFNSSVIRQVEENRYTDAQIHTLMQQKSKVKKVIEESEAFHPNVTVRRKKLSVPFKKADIKAQMTLAAKCSLHCCHTCRPYYRDRVFASLVGVAENIDAAYGQTLFKDLKVVDAAIVRQLALRKPIDGHFRLMGSAQTSTSRDSLDSNSSSYGEYNGDSGVIDVSEHSGRLAEMPVHTSTLENVGPKEQHRLTYPWLAFDNSGISIPETHEESENTSTIGHIVNKLRNASNKMLKRSLSVPTDSGRSKVTRLMSRKSSTHIGSAESDQDVSEMEPVALSEMAVEEHVPDVMTQA